MYTETDFRTKKQLKDAIATGKQIRVYNPEPISEPPENGKVYLEGPHFPRPHTWYAQGWLENGILIKVNRRKNDAPR